MLKILHLDRSELFRKVMREIVLRCGHSVESLSSVGEARRALSSCGVDLVLTGLELDDGSGESLIREMSQGPCHEIPIIVITSTDSIEMRERLFALGVVDYLLKNEIDEVRLKRYLDTLAVQDELSRFMRSLRVAVLDDSKVILKIVANILKLHGFQSVSLFEDPEALLSSAERFDLYLTDIVLPGMTGEQVVARLREAGSEAIVICMSQFATDKPLAGILLAGADDYIPKPFDAQALLARIKVNVRSYQLKKRLELMAVTDGLTGLYNHRYCFERLEEEVAKARRYGRRLSVLMLDVDDFKKVNDTRGHKAGDEVLVSVADSVKARLRGADVAARYGGEEFLVILPETGIEAARQAAEKLRAAIAGLSGPAGGVTASFGAAELVSGEGATGLVNRADGFLYEAKRSGKNRVAG